MRLDAVRWPRAAGTPAWAGEDALWRREALQAHETRARAGLPAGALMARAGEVAARLARALAPQARRRLVLCGPGHNGGDGWAMAASLRDAGLAVEVLALEPPRPPEAAAAAARARAAGVEAIPPARLEACLAGLGADDLVVDAVFGLGLRADRAAPPWFAGLRAALAGARAPSLALDLPSGLDADTGQTLASGALAAGWTLSLLGHKPGLWTGEGRDLAGAIWHHGLGVDAADAPGGWRLLDGAALAWPARRHASHKGRHGTVAVVGGAPGMAGALRLASGAALRAGAGRVVAVGLGGLPPAADAACMHGEAADWLDRHEAARGRREQAVMVLGCGAGRALDSRLHACLDDAPRLLLDADALNAVAAIPPLQAALRGRAGRGQTTVLTPHPREAARLLGDTVDTVQADRLAAARRLAGHLDAWVVLKGSGSVIADPAGGGWVNTSGNGRLASAGTGDVLAGWIGGLWAQFGEAGAACRLGTWSHGAAAEALPPAGRTPGPLHADALLAALEALPRA